jgi:hypothetical protein
MSETPEVRLGLPARRDEGNPRLTSMSGRGGPAADRENAVLAMERDLHKRGAALWVRTTAPAGVAGYIAGAREFLLGGGDERRLSDRGQSSAHP